MKKLQRIATVGWLLSGCATHVSPTQTSVPASATATIVAKAGPEDLYPNPQFTPGATNPDVTQANIKETICKSGWTATVRPSVSYTNKLKTQGITQYGYRDSQMKDYEEDHFIPLELGGNPTDPRNLWPEPYRTKAGTRTMGARQKDKVEGLLKKQVCAGTIRLKEAQEQIAGDWYKIYVANF